jgi:hypothetical protein
MLVKDAFQPLANVSRMIVVGYNDRNPPQGGIELPEQKKKQ